jgi:hypothetical protein
VLLEKVMRSLPSVKAIYVGISSKVRGRGTPEIRHDKLYLKWLSSSDIQISCLGWRGLKPRIWTFQKGN